MKIILKWLIGACITGCCLHSALASYLGYPRIHFAGRVRINSNTRNNDPCNYRPHVETNPDLDQADWGANGTNEFEFVDCKVVRALNQDGVALPMDPAMGLGVFGNLDGPLGKISDRGSDHHSSVFGLNFGLKWSEEEEEDQVPERSDDIAFYGKWTRSVIAQFMWPRIVCYKPGNSGGASFQGSHAVGSQFTTTITDIDWHNLGGGDGGGSHGGQPEEGTRRHESEVLSQLRQASMRSGGGDGGRLSVRVTMFHYTRNYAPSIALNATLGYVMGAIGVPSEREAFNVPGARGMFPKDPPLGLTFKEKSDICHEYKGSTKSLTWTNFAPFEVARKGSENKFEVRVDLSNSLPAHLYNSLRDIGTLQVGVLHNRCVQILNEDASILYLSADNFKASSGIYAVEFPAAYEADVASKPLVVVQKLSDETAAGGHTICGEMPSGRDSVQILLQESPYFVRPYGYYIDHLEKLHRPQVTQSVYVTQFGQPASGVPVYALLDDHSQVGPPRDGVTPPRGFVLTNASGIADVTYTYNEEAGISLRREYFSPPCKNDPSTTLPIDGQRYFFHYCVDVEGSGRAACDGHKYITSYFLAFAEFNETKQELTWEDDIRDIFYSYAHVSPAMTKILDLGNYTAVVVNRGMVRRSLEWWDFEDAGYMPTTRDLSTAKRNAILRWLENPKFKKGDEGVLPHPSVPVCTFPGPVGVALPPLPPPSRPVTLRCEEFLAFKDPPDVLDPRYDDILKLPVGAKMVAAEPVDCSREGVMRSLQTAIELEWSTIPVYLTSLYSIREGCNYETYELIQSVVVQEMLHFTQAANTIIAMGGRPLIDQHSISPSYPRRGLPGDVLPNLLVTLERLSLEHIHKVFMSIEVPEERAHGGMAGATIGKFYETHIKECISKGGLSDEDFRQSDPRKQVRWPWVPSDVTGNVVLVNSTKTALEGVEMIVTQGEGSGLLNPNQIGNKSYAHFYKFEEIVCKHRLQRVNETHYSYSGPLIPHDPRGMWKMRPNPRPSDIPVDSNCYTNARAFHRIYRKLLRKLQDVFDEADSKDGVMVAVQLMEALKVNAKTLMWTKHLPEATGEDQDEEVTCGPVWDYYWPEDN